MFQLRRNAAQGAGRAPATISKVTKRYSTGHHGKTGDEVHHHAGSSIEHGHHHAGPKDEPLGSGFFVVLAAIPVAIGVWTTSRPSADGKVSGFTKFIDSYSYYKERWAARNTLHTAAIEQAAFDRNLFQSSPGSVHVDLRFPEIFNTGSPFNVVAGQQPRNMDKLVAHYTKINSDAEEKKAKALAEKSS